ncbi:Sel1 repeat-containing protein [Stella humosa]|uniref:Sel1 repeat-containing protein n=1 Tax=Stella humosa TaxID=94 RepID=A0A3N1MCL4_9PROT|nr:SEL1-like repeat protein [Stella humosa]ROQ01453.1 Sel1 repeat-containing protein [Stella humosa]BBK31830.1 hypothetical protein STHU_24640 [Stella humosa]
MRIRSIAFIASALALAAPATASAQDYAAGLRCYEFNDFGCALNQWMPLANNGVTRAQYRIGSLYAEGTGVPTDKAEAYKWFAIAAAKGDRTAAEAIQSIGPTMSQAEVEEGMRRAGEYRAMRGRRS